MMTLEEFKSHAERFPIVPVGKTILADTLTPVSAYLRLRPESGCSFLFESVEGGERVARYSFIGRNALKVISCCGSVTSVNENGTSHTTNDGFFDVVERMVEGFHQPPLEDLPRFTGGLVGFIGYDAIRFIEEIPRRDDDSLSLPHSMLALFATIIAFDHVKQQVIVIHNVVIDRQVPPEEQFSRAVQDIIAIEQLLAGGQPHSRPFSASPDNIRHETTRDEFRRRVESARKYISEGDIFQVVLSQRFSLDYSGDLFNVYRALRVVNPSPYLYYLDFQGTCVIGSSPEILVRKQNDIVETYPIAGTRPRGKTETEDNSLEQELLADEKERAEHIMLVDLGRNDLGRVCETGSVNVGHVMSVVRYSHVMHLASRVSGKVMEGRTSMDIFRATFPAGTVSGAPKIRAMEIINELEPVNRGIYAGGVGYIDFFGTMDFCITIRTMIGFRGKLFFQAGAGIVADSDPAREYEETVNKARALVEALRMAEGIAR